MEYLHESPGVGKSLVKMCVCAKLKLLTGEYRYYYLAGCTLVFFVTISMWSLYYESAFEGRVEK